MQGYQYHLNSDIAIAHWQYFLQTNDTTWLREKGWPIIENVGDMFANFVTKTEDKYHTIFMTDPNEYVYNITDGVYTNIAIKMLLGEWAPSAAKILYISTQNNWSDIAANIEISYDKKEDLILEWPKMRGVIETKQADVVLLNYPLDYRISEHQAQNDMTFIRTFPNFLQLSNKHQYAAANSHDGPAMTWSVFAIGEVQLQEKGCAAYAYLLRGSSPYLRAPFYQISEQLIDDASLNGGAESAFPFLTGHGGYLQVFTHGFTGFRPRLDAFYIDPMLPPQLPHGVQVKGMKYQGAAFDVDIQLENTTITRRPSKFNSNLPIKDPLGPVTVRIGPKNASPGDYPLLPNEVLIIPTRRPDLNGTAMPGNLAQCKIIVSASPWTPGNFPEAILDGENATYWQPASEARANVTVYLGRAVNVSGVFVLWGKAPLGEGYAAGSDADERQGDWRMLYSTDKVAVSAPYAGRDASAVKIREGNSSVGVFEGGHMRCGL